MPNGGSDNCATCWHNSRHPGQAGYGSFPDARCECLLRGVPIEDPLFTYCPNHPHHDPGKTPFPVGPIYVGEPGPGLTYTRKVIVPSPRTEAVRQGLVGLLEAMPEKPTAEYPSPTRFHDEVILQLGEFKEARAVPGLRRVLAFAPLARAPIQVPEDEAVLGAEPMVDRIGTIGRAMEALAKILGEPAADLLEPYLGSGLEKKGQPLEVYEKLAPLRALAARALALCGDRGKAALQKALQDPVADVSGEARRLLGCWTLAATLTLAVVVGGHAGPGEAPPGISSPALPLAAETTPASPDPRPILALDIPELERLREQGWLGVQAGPARIEMTPAFSDKPGFHLLVREGPFEAAAIAPEELARGAFRKVPSGVLTLRLEPKGMLSVTLEAGGGGPPHRTEIPSRALIGPIYTALPKVVLGIVEYAVVRERGGREGLPPAVTLIRKDGEGAYWLAHHPDTELSKVVWLLAVDGTLYGVRKDGRLLVFLKKPLPPPPS